MSQKLAIGGIALALVAGGAWWLSSSMHAPDPVEQLTPLGAANAQETTDVEIDTSTIVEMTMGPADAAVTVTEYASFTCPHCARFHSDQFKRLKADYIDTGKVHFVYRDVYFDRYGLWAAMVARCDGQNRFFGIADMLYQQQGDWVVREDPIATADNLRKLGRVAGLEEDTLEACLADNAKAKTLVKWYQDHSNADGVSSTPTLLVNGEKYGNMRYSELKGVIDGLLAE